MQSSPTTQTQSLGPRWDYSRLHPILTTPLINPSSEGRYEDWSVLGHSSSHFDIHIYGSRGSPGFTSRVDKSLVCFHASSYYDTACQLLHRTYLHHLRHLSDQNTLYITRLSILSTRIYSSSYSATIDWTMRMLGTTELGGASSLMFVEDGVTSYTPRHSTLVCIFSARMAPL